MTNDEFTVLHGVQKRAFSAILYGNAGIGKTTLAARAPAPILIDIEGGCARVDVDKTPTLGTWPDVRKWMKHLHGNIGNYKTVIFDTIDVLETYMHDHICKTEGKASIEKFGYGAGYKMAVDLWRLLTRFQREMNDKGVNVILIAHEQIKHIDPPTSEGFDRYQIKINHNSANLLVGAVDAVLFAHWDTIVKDTDRDNVKRAIGTGKRLLACVETPAITAKNRYDLKPIEKMEASIWERLS